MFLIISGFISILCAWKWGDWKNWRQYLSTIQYFIIGDMLYNLFTQDFPLWNYPSPPNLLPNHLFNNLFIMFIIYPSTLLIFLYRFPKRNFFKQLLHILFWIFLWAVFEFFMVYYELCVYYHGWTYSWSIFFASIMVLMLLLHYKHPLWAYMLSVPITAFFLFWFHVPIFSGK
ncbi:CBO0543 family protein [Bacillus salipaludis]|uniref:CBO0543 family protein n=1 Tax=Bacillus salipaludis TaxID=2547811 RepID=A0ABW8RC34_9BACI